MPPNYSAKLAHINTMLSPSILKMDFGVFINIWLCQRISYICWIYGSRFHTYAGFEVQDPPPPPPPPQSSAANPELVGHHSPGSWGPGPRPSGRLMQLCSAPSSRPSTLLSSGNLWLHTRTHSESHSITHTHLKAHTQTFKVTASHTQICKMPK